MRRNRSRGGHALAEYALLVAAIGLVLLSGGGGGVLAQFAAACRTYLDSFHFVLSVPFL
jgi:hypothetical protein